MRRVPTLGVSPQVDDESGLNEQLPSLGVTYGPAVFVVDDMVSGCVCVCLCVCVCVCVCVR